MGNEGIAPGAPKRHYVGVTVDIDSQGCIHIVSIQYSAYKSYKIIGSRLEGEDPARPGSVRYAISVAGAKHSTNIWHEQKTNRFFVVDLQPGERELMR